MAQDQIATSLKLGLSNQAVRYARAVIKVMRLQ